MARRLSRACILALVLVTAFGNVAFSATQLIALSPESNSVVLVRHPGPEYGQVKVIIDKDTQRYIYDVRLSDEPERLPLQMGEGIYTVRLMRRTTGTLYQEITQRQFAVKQENPLEVYLQSVQNVLWDNSPETVQKAAELVESATSDAEKVLLVYDFMVRNFVYDRAKARAVTPGYLPDLDQTLSDGKGICYDFASLFAGMLRSLQIPTRLVTGYVGPLRAYHAWNEVYVDGEWQGYDLTRGISSSNKSPDLSITSTYEIRYRF